MSMGGSLKYISSLSHKNSKKSEQKCEGRIFQKGVSIKFCKYFTFSYYSRRWLGETKWRWKCFCLKKMYKLLYLMSFDMTRSSILLQRVSFQVNMR